jgi:hypothetical protein
MTSLPRQVVCAAIRHRQTQQIICAPRHHHCFWALGGLSQEYPHDDWEQGFVDQYNEFLTRAEALQLAEERGQIQRRTGGGDELFSEDLY